MRNKLQTYLTEGFCYTGLEISESGGITKYLLLEVKKVKNELQISSEQELENFTALDSYIKKDRPVFININTTAVLTKQIENVGSTNFEVIVNQAFPNLDLRNFYYEVIQLNTAPIVTIIKKEQVDSLITKLKELKINIMGVSLGISVVEIVSSYLKNNSILTTKNQLNFNENSITNISSLTKSNAFLESKLHINGLSLSNKYILPFAHILKHLSQKPTNSNFITLLDSLKWKFKNQRIFNQVLKFSLVFFIILLLSNFFVFNWYYDKVGELNAVMAATSSQTNELAQLDASVKKKQERVKTLTLSSNSKASYYLDIFAQTIPNSVLLNEIKFQPLAKPVQIQKPIILENEKIVVSGVSKDINDFSIWIEELEKLKWITSVETLDYDYISKNTSDFLLEIEFHED